MPFKEKIRYLIGKHRVSYYAIFKVTLPFLMSMLQIDCICAIVSAFIASRGAYVRDFTLTLIAYAAFFAFLIFLPKFSSFLEFLLHPFSIFLIFREGLSNTVLITLTLTTTSILLLSKTYFYFAFILEDELRKKDNYDSASYF